MPLGHPVLPRPPPDSGEPSTNMRGVWPAWPSPPHWCWTRGRAWGPPTLLRNTHTSCHPVGKQPPWHTATPTSNDYELQLRQVSALDCHSHKQRLWQATTLIKPQWRQANCFVEQQLRNAIIMTRHKIRSEKPELTTTQTSFNFHKLQLRRATTATSHDYDKRLLRKTTITTWNKSQRPNLWQAIIATAVIITAMCSYMWYAAAVIITALCKQATTMTSDNCLQ